MFLPAWNGSGSRQDKITSVGRAVNDMVLAIVDEEGQPVKESSSPIGRLAIRSAARMLGYYQEPELTQETLHGEWLYTNDAACWLDSWITISDEPLKRSVILTRIVNNSKVYVLQNNKK